MKQLEGSLGGKEASKLRNSRISLTALAVKLTEKAAGKILGK